MTTAPRGLCGALLGLAASAAGAAVHPGQVDAATLEPRAFGYQLGDLVSRTVTTDAADGLVLDESSVPRAGARGNALELRSVARRSSTVPGGRRLELTLTYQVFLSPPQPRTGTRASRRLRASHAPRSPSMPAGDRVAAGASGVSPRRGLGELQPPRCRR
jgi:mxaA protein